MSGSGDGPPAPATLRLAFFVREPYPTSRVDVEVLFARELAARGYRLDLIMQDAERGAVPSSVQWHGARVLLGPTDKGSGFRQRLRKHLLALWHEVRSLARISRRTHDLVQVRDKILIAALAAPLARLRGLPFYYWLSFPISEVQVLRAREGSARYPWLSLVRGSIAQVVLYRWIMPLARHVFVQSEQMKRDVMARGIPAEKLTPVPMGIERRLLGKPRAAMPARDDFVVGHLGVISAQRRLTVLVDVLELLVRSGVNARLLFVGDGREPPDRQAIERRAAELGIRDRVEITGFLPHAEALERISAVDVGVSPFYPTPVLRSTSPTKLVEYFALGLPVVANDHPEQALILGECRGGVCVPWAARHFARALRFLALAGPERRHAMGQRGRAWVEGNRTYDRLAASIDEVYRRTAPAPVQRG